MVAQITFDLKLDVLRAVLEHLAALQCTSKFGIHHIIAQIGDVPEHARDAQTSFRNNAVRVKMPAMKIWIGGDRTASHLIERDVFCIQIRGAGNDHGMAYSAGVLQAPTQCLHATQTAAHHGRQLRDAHGI